jgi:hypothetical protein
VARDDQTEDIYGDLLSVGEEPAPDEVAVEPEPQQEVKPPSPSGKTAWAYTISEHENFAPHIQDGVLSLACCMAFIRQHAKVGEWVIGVGTVSTGRRLVFAALITGEMTRAQYWEKYRNTRLDSIYRPTPDGGYEQVPNIWHGEKRVKYDMQSNRVLLSTKFHNFSRGHYYEWSDPSGIEFPDEFSFLRVKGIRNSGKKFYNIPESFFKWMDGEQQEELQTLDDPERILP